MLVLSDPRRFAELAGPYLSADPFSTNVIGVRLGSVLAGRRPRGQDDIWVAVTDGDAVVGVAMHTPPARLFLGRLPSGMASEIARALNDRGRSRPGVTGDAATAGEFAQAWSRHTGAEPRLDCSLRLYRLDRLNQPKADSGQARRAGMADGPVLTDWLVSFESEIGTERADKDAADIVRRRTEAGELWLWEVDGEPVCMAGVSAPAAGVARVGPVYTPPARRRHGYAAALTAHVSQEASDAGADHVVLYADLANPTSNGIYLALGYVADHDSDEWEFTSPP